MGSLERGRLAADHQGPACNRRIAGESSSSPLAPVAGFCGPRQVTPQGCGWVVAGSENRPSVNREAANTAYRHFVNTDFVVICLSKAKEISEKSDEESLNELSQYVKDY